MSQPLRSTARISVRMNCRELRPYCMEALQRVFGRRGGFDHAIRANFVRPSWFIRLRDFAGGAGLEKCIAFAERDFRLIDLDDSFQWFTVWIATAPGGGSARQAHHI